MSAELLDVERLADAFHAKVCGPFTTIDPQQCLGGRQRDVTIAAAIAREYARLDSRSPSEVYDNADRQPASPENIR